MGHTILRSGTAALWLKGNLIFYHRSKPPFWRDYFRPILEAICHPHVCNKRGKQVNIGGFISKVDNCCSLGGAYCSLWISLPYPFTTLSLDVEPAKMADKEPFCRNEIKIYGSQPSCLALIVAEDSLGSDN